VGNTFKEGEKVLFIHTGGVFGLYDKEKQLLDILPKETITKMEIDTSKRVN
jgi:hypothetical protein